MARFGAKIQIGAIPTSVYELWKTVFSLEECNLMCVYLKIKVKPKNADCGGGSEAKIQNDDTRIVMSKINENAR